MNLNGSKVTAYIKLQKSDAFSMQQFSSSKEKQMILLDERKSKVKYFI